MTSIATHSVKSKSFTERCYKPNPKGPDFTTLLLYVCLMLAWTLSGVGCANNKHSLPRLDDPSKLTPRMVEIIEDFYRREGSK